MTTPDEAEEVEATKMVVDLDADVLVIDSRTGIYPSFRVVRMDPMVLETLVPISYCDMHYHPAYYWISSRYCESTTRKLPNRTENPEYDYPMTQFDN